MSVIDSDTESIWFSNDTTFVYVIWSSFCVLQEASKLSSDKRLSKCPRCESPARTEPAQNRAQCIAPECEFDYCLRCQKPFHGKAACKRFVSRSALAPVAVGSQRSRRNLRRLWHYLSCQWPMNCVLWFLLQSSNLVASCVSRLIPYSGRIVVPCTEEFWVSDL